MKGQVRNSGRRRIYLWLTTSTRDRRNRTDDVGTHLQAARRERNKVHRVNDLFHASGMWHHPRDTLEGIILQGMGRGLAWSFVIVPACFVLTFIVCITSYRGGDRRARQQHAQEEWQHHLLEAVQKRAAAEKELQSVCNHAMEAKSVLRPIPEEQRWAAQLEANMAFINEKLQSRLGDGESRREGG
ncbi:conserved hypothetical protein [Leishmania major strain Friedlin]|uniref:Uncharacterized protein n=1 Tax=Leishmania major TaxID=5664 RepID=Q4QBF1_LEIMA|nr:conserved hypothetical protein [Leishmania major strain Friedlin]CAG9574116.1 hypothetical_protein_-_conserved [Leishmania major strain Friedlin]CAJ03964.1 conserved hypothetical protein [Leishmania major strain Friedlin]|eukprot:XP_001683347.1 conserved hypothetical protein [Leishmania major strain Friedlin]